MISVTLWGRSREMQSSFSVQQNLIYVYNEDYSQAIPSPPQSDEKIDNEPEGPAAWEPDADLGDEEAEKNEDKEMKVAKRRRRRRTNRLKMRRQQCPN